VGFSYSLKRIFKTLEASNVLSAEQINVINEKLDEAVVKEVDLIKKTTENFNINDLNSIKDLLGKEGMDV